MERESKVINLFKLVDVTAKDIPTVLGLTRVFWVRENLKSNKSPLVLIHGWAAGAGCFFKNVADLAKDRALLLIDIPGFAESDRPEFSEKPEIDWVSALNEVFDAEL